MIITTSLLITGCIAHQKIVSLTEEKNHQFVENKIVEKKRYPIQILW